MQLTLPLLGDVMTEGKLARWLQLEGATVEQGMPLYEVETDKVTFTVDAPASGRLERVVTEGATVPVGGIVARLVDESRVAAEPEVRATPVARAAARRLGVDLRRIANGQRLREADVLRAAESRGGVSALSGRRKVIAERMRSSLRQSAQVTEAMEVDMTNALRLRDQLGELFGGERRPSITDLVIRAVVLALRDHPMLNATLVEGELQIHREVHVGVAVDAEEGLIVPVVHGAQMMDLVELASQTREVVERARRNALRAEEVLGATFTVTSLGSLGVDFFTPIINPPQVAILGIGRTFTKLALEADRVTERTCMYLNLSFDHQVVDGAPAARFLQSVKRVLELAAALVVQSPQ